MFCNFVVAADTSQSVDIMTEPDTLALVNFPNITISWNPEALLPLIDPNLFTVDIFLTQLNMDTLQFELFEVLGRNIPNIGILTYLFLRTMLRTLM